MSIENPVINKVFNDLETYLDYCRGEGKVFNEQALYNKEDPNWIAYQKYQGWIRAKARNGGKPFEKRPNPRFNNNNRFENTRSN